MTSFQTPVVVFAYNFPHKKTQDFLLHLFVHGVPVCTVLAADPVELKVGRPSVRAKLRHSALLHPRMVASAIGAQYMIAPHNSEDAITLLAKLQPEIGIIAGARILSRAVIDCFRIGVINFHPGLIPEARGLDAMQWSILNGHPLGVTSHMINEDIDAGHILLKYGIDLYADDTILDLSERLYETQLEMLVPSIKAAVEGHGVEVPVGTQYNRKMSPELERQVLEVLPAYVSRYVKGA